MILLNIERTRLRNAIIKVWRLAIEYHTIEQSDITDGNKHFLINSIKQDWQKKVNDKLVANGWGEVSINSAFSEEDISEIAYKTCNKIKSVEHYYGKS